MVKSSMSEIFLTNFYYDNIEYDDIIIPICHQKCSNGALRYLRAIRTPACLWPGISYWRDCHVHGEPWAESAPPRVP